MLYMQTYRTSLVVQKMFLWPQNCGKSILKSVVLKLLKVFFVSMVNLAILNRQIKISLLIFKYTSGL